MSETISYYDWAPFFGLGLISPQAVDSILMGLLILIRSGVSRGRLNEILLKSVRYFSLALIIFCCKCTACYTAVHLQQQVDLVPLFSK